MAGELAHSHSYRVKYTCIWPEHTLIRWPHWVTPYSGERFSLIFYHTVGEVVPRHGALPQEPSPLGELSSDVEVDLATHQVVTSGNLHKDQTLVK